MMKAWRGVLLGGLLVAAMAVVLVPRMRPPASPSSVRPTADSSVRAERQPAADPLRLRASERVPPRRPGKESAAVEGPGRLTPDQVRRYFGTPVVKGHLPFLPYPGMKAPDSSVFEAMKKPYDSKRDADRFLLPSSPDVSRVTGK